MLRLLWACRMLLISLVPYSLFRQPSAVKCGMTMFKKALCQNQVFLESMSREVLSWLFGTTLSIMLAYFNAGKIKDSPLPFMWISWSKCMLWCPPMNESFTQESPSEWVVHTRLRTYLLIQVRSSLSCLVAIQGAVGIWKPLIPAWVFGGSVLWISSFWTPTSLWCSERIQEVVCRTADFCS